jgi:hypothetical protein
MPVTVGTTAGNKTVDEVWVGTASGNKQVLEGWIGTAAGNKQFYASAVITLNSLSYSSAGTATFTLSNAGVASGSGQSNYDWCSPGSASSGYDVFLHVTAFSTPAGSASETWLSMGTTRSWNLTGPDDSIFEISIRDSTSLSVVAGPTLVSINAT